MSVPDHRVIAIETIERMRHELAEIAILIGKTSQRITPAAKAYDLLIAEGRLVDLDSGMVTAASHIRHAALDVLAGEAHASTSTSKRSSDQP